MANSERAKNAKKIKEGYIVTRKFMDEKILDESGEAY